MPNDCRPAGSYRVRLPLALVILGLGGPASPADLQAVAAPPPIFETEVALVAAPVFVTDRSGRAVRGLAAHDFEVYDGGTRVPIVAFQAVDVDAPAASAALAAHRVPAAVQAAAARQFVLLFDLQFSPPAGVRRAREAAARFVRESLAPGDLVAAATFRPTGLRMLTGFTTDRAHVARAIERQGFVMGNLDADSDPLGLGGDIGEIVGGGTGSDLDQEIASEMGLLSEALLREYQYRVLDFVGSIDDLAAALSAVRGRKQVVLFSGGYLEAAWTDSLGANSQGGANALDGAREIRSRMREAFSRAGVSDMVIHSIDLGGLEGAVSLPSRTGSDSNRGGGRQSLAALALSTGGRLVPPTNDLDAALAEVDAISRRYYVLAFQPAEPAPKAGRSRGLKVRVKRDGLTVSHRAAYAIPKPAPATDPAARRMVAAEAIAKGLSGGQLGLHLVAMPYRDRHGSAAVPAVLHVEGKALAAAAKDGRLAVQVYGYALEAGRVLDSLVFDTTFDLAKAGPSLASEGLRVLAVFTVQPGTVDIRFFVRAGDSATGSVRREVEVPAFVEGHPAPAAVMPALPATGKMVALAETQGRPSLEVPFRVGGVPFLPDGSPELGAGQPTVLCAFLWRPSASGTPLDVTAEIVRAGGAPLPVHIEGLPRVVPDADGFDRLVATVVPPRAAPGDYVLRLTFRDAATGWTAASETEIALTGGEP